MADDEMEFLELLEDVEEEERAEEAHAAARPAGVRADASGPVKPRRKNGFSIAGLVVALVGLVPSFTFPAYMGFLMGGAALCLCVVGLGLKKHLFGGAMGPAIPGLLLAVICLTAGVLHLF